MLKGFLDRYVIAGDSTPPATPTAPAAAAASIAAPGSTTVVENEFFAVLRNLIKGRQTAFTTLLNASEKLAAIIPDPSTRIKAAYATVAGEGRGLREILSAIDVHISDLEGQRMQFERAVETQKQQAIGQLQNELTAMGTANQTAQTQIDSMMNQIQQLQTMIGNNSTKAGELQINIANETAKFSARSQQFEAALTAVKSELEVQKSAMASTLA